MDCRGFGDNPCMSKVPCTPGAEQCWVCEQKGLRNPVEIRRDIERAKSVEAEWIPGLSAYRLVDTLARFA